MITIKSIIFKGFSLLLILVFSACSSDHNTSTEESIDNLPDVTGYPIVDTNQSLFFDEISTIIEPLLGSDYYGQDAQYMGNQPNYTDNGDGTLTDNVTGLMWQNSFDHNEDGSVDYDDKLAYDEILALVENGFTYAEHSDWRVPTIKELYSLIMFNGKDISGYEGTSTDGLTPFINTNFFNYAYGDLDAGERLIDVQCATTNLYVGSTFEEMVFGVNFADGRIKGYGTSLLGEDKAFNYLLVRGNSTYGENDFTDNNDGTITDNATGLMWMKNDNGEGVIWKDALSYAESSEYAGYNDWRLPNAKELQSIVDYTRSPQSTNSPAIDALFNATQIISETGQDDYPWYWSGTTHQTWVDENDGAWGVYVCFGRATGNMDGWVDVHGAGSQRSDPKTGDPSVYEEGHGPQGDGVRIYNYVRLVRDF
ncbi:Lcl C-terminal domain-containing protein [Winogradskyella endarachnes]|uniref:DUF1566 domain-containing protein n=1 Tax=Winogradskyella endarachnes TaxID=2681965 RepID=A0A6L6U7G6_9FLAO|nr:DUF1566 domain-containing protein [Winogradskyella endarachnes]MUU78225.1 DUF1566 domain-containing protein [Winogradskyella endarachnes]